MKKLIFLFLLPACFCFADEFYDQAAFTNAIGNRTVLSDSFANEMSNIPGVSVSSDIIFNGVHPGDGNGHFAPGMYVDATAHYTVTTWTFSTPIYAFGGDWNMSPVDAGLTVGAFDSQGSNIATYNMPDGVVPPWSSYPNPPSWPQQSFSGFWGFISSRQVSQVRIVFGDEGTPNDYSQSYEFTNLQITEAAAAATPEPQSIALLLMGTGILGFLVVRKRKRETLL
ncbi:MAG TPA: PEP-CTERM sorting domain-containing protein [Bryobacteraceae bacterium]